MMGDTAVPEARVFHTLDALRGVAAIGVVIYHMSGSFVPMATPGGYLAVDLFFMMSGVVLSHAYEARFQAGMGTLGFMRARLIRLYPLYFLGTLLGIAVSLASMHGHNIQGWSASTLVQASLLALFFLPNFSVQPVNEMFPLNIPSWSLLMELLVNFLFVVFWRLLTSRRLIVLSLLTGAGVALRIVHLGNLNEGSVASSFVFGLVRTVFGFSVGVLIARHIRHVPRRHSNLLVLTILAVVLVAIIGWPGGRLRPAWDAVCVLLVFPWMVYWGTVIDPGARLQRIATFLGVTSYAVYVLHSPLSSITNSVARFFAGGAGVAAGAPYLGIGVLACLLIGCWLLDRYVDMPVRRQLSRIVPKLHPLPAQL